MYDPQTEYDRFGPWISEITPADPAPPLFQEQSPRAETPLLAIKIPRNIDRRDAHPGMHLYDYLVTLYEEEIAILERVEDGVQAHVFAYDDIRYLRTNVDLLRGHLTLGLDGRTYDLPFSTVSKEIIQRLVDLARPRYTKNGMFATAPEQAPAPSGGLSFLFSRLLAKEQRDKRLLAAQAGEAIGWGETSGWRRLAARAADKRLLEALHFSDGRELTIISRGRAYKYAWQKVYALDTLYLPTGNLTGAAWQDEAQNTAVATLLLHTAAGPLSYTLRRDNPGREPYARYLEALASGAPVGV